MDLIDVHDSKIDCDTLEEKKIHGRKLVLKAWVWAGTKL
jgi:hypothetical protein